MTTLLLFFPPVLYLSVVWLISKRYPARLRTLWPFVCAGSALLACGAIAYALAGSKPVGSPAEVAWTGIETTSRGDSLRIGGARDQASVGWPNGAFFPEVRFSQLSNSTASMVISGGLGFVRDAEGRILNGTPVPPGQAIEFEGARIIHKTRIWPLRRRLAIAAITGASLADVALPRSGKDRVLVVEGLIAGPAAELRKNGRAADAAKLEQWAGPLRLLLTRSGELRILGQGATRADLKLPAELTVLWRNLSLPVRVRFTDNQERLQLAFVPPLRLSSPLPEGSQSNPDARLVVTGKPLPGDTAFVFPLGAELTSFREVVSMPHGRFAPRSRPIEVPIWLHAVSRPDSKAVREVTSEQRIRVEPPGTNGSFYLFLATIQDLPRPALIWMAIGLALATLAAALKITYGTLRAADGAALGGLCATVWTLLIFRMLLAYRFALDPSKLDPLAVSGLATALVGLAVLPGVILIAARLRRDVTALISTRDRTRNGLWLLGLSVWLILAGGIQARLASAMWPNAQAFAPSLSLFEAVLVFSIGMLVADYILFHYLIDLNDQVWNDHYALLSRCKELLAAVFDVFRHVALRLSRHVWRHIGAVANSRDTAPSSRQFWIFLGRLLAAEVIVLLAIRLGVRLSGSGVKVAQEIAAPLAFCWTPAFVWLGSRLRFPVDMQIGEFHWKRAAALAACAVIGPVFLFPIAIDDAGGVVVTFGVFFSVCLLLLMGGAPRRIGWIASGALLIALFGGGLLYLNLNRILPQISGFGPAAQRMLIFKEDSALRKFLVYFPVAPGGGAPSYTALRNGLEHTWENRAMAHEGGVFPGLGFGNSPTYLSNVNQDTLQFDSTFSFYVASENGLVGGLLLLLLYAIPVIVLLHSARAQFDIGHGVAIVILCDFFFEAAVHAAMNLGALPFTGRSMPLLSVNSNTDLLRWGVLLWIAAQAMQWRVTPAEEGFSDSCSLLSGLRRPSVPGERHIRPESSWHFRRGAFIICGALLAPIILICYHGGANLANPEFGRPFDWHDLLTTVQQLADSNRIRLRPDKTIEADADLFSNGGSLLEQEIARFNALTLDEKMEGPRPEVPPDFSGSMSSLRSLDEYDQMLASFRKRDMEATVARTPPLLQLTEEPETVDGDSPGFRIVPNPAFNTRVSFRVAKDTADFPTVTFRDGAGGAFLIRGPGFEFYVPDRLPLISEPDRKLLLETSGGSLFHAIEDAQNESARVRVALRFPTGKLASEVRLLGDWERGAGGLTFRAGKFPMTVTRKPAAVRTISPGAESTVQPGDTITLESGEALTQRVWFEVGKVARGAIIGPAWVMGHWRLESDSEAGLAWMGQYRAALLAEWYRLGKEQAAKQYSTLSVDRGLQLAASAFMGAHTRTHYDEMLRTKAPAAVILPPRSALSIITIPNGEVLALGGWPRSSQDTHWRTNESGEVLPASTWVDRRAPHSLRARYQSDRNFDRLVVGSATKPIWAGAVLALQPDLDRIFRVKGHEEKQNEVFGIGLTGRPWHVAASRSLTGAEWTDFASFLAYSDNRYQVRLGFLGLAERGAAGPAVTSRHSDSVEESMDGGQTPWARFPKFPEEIEFNEHVREHMQSLQNTRLAERLHRMFGIGVHTGEIETRNFSFWTGDESDDRPDGERHRPSSLLWPICPESPVFALENVTSPRQFVSLLLGGGSNMWSNVDLAAAFATAVTGKPVVVHATLAGSKPAVDRDTFPEIARKLRPGLRAVIANPDGTANAAFNAAGALQWLQKLRGVAAFGKTGTLSPDSGGRPTSRMLVVLLYTGQDGQERGLALSLVVESVAVGTAARWMAEFLAAHGAELERYLQ